MDIQLIDPADLGESQLAAWTRLQQANTALDSAFFSPQFTQAVASFRDDLEVAVMEQDGEIAGFFPFHRNRWRVGRPVGLRLSDLHGVVVSDDVAWDPQELILGCGLAAWHFRNMPVSHKPIGNIHRATVGSPYIDVVDGLEANENARRRAGSSLIAQIRRKSRKIEREIGPLRFEWPTTDKEVFETLLALKSGQRRRTQTYNVLRFRWVVELLDHIRLCQTDGFTGVLYALYVNDEIAAIHLGMRSSTVFHFWFPTYNPAYAKYSPGLILLLELVRECAMRGMKRIDLGQGLERYKTSLMSGSLTLAEGCVAVRPATKVFQVAYYGARTLARSKLLRGPVSLSKRMIRRIDNGLSRNVG